MLRELFFPTAFPRVSPGRDYLSFTIHRPGAGRICAQVDGRGQRDARKIGVDREILDYGFDGLTIIRRATAVEFSQACQRKARFRRISSGFSRQAVVFARLLALARTARRAADYIAATPSRRAGRAFTSTQDDAPFERQECEGCAMPDVAFHA